MKRWMKWLLPVPVFLAVLILGFAWFLLRTETGAAWVIDLAKRQLPGTLVFGELEGDFTSGLYLSSWNSNGMVCRLNRSVWGFPSRRNGLPW